MKMQEPTPVEVVCAVIRRGGRVLIARRPAGKRLAGLWEFPGGKLEPGESTEAALHRELSEELGCRVTGLQAGPEVLHAYPWCTVRMFAFACTLAADSPPPVALEHTDLAWVAPADLAGCELAPADLPLLPWIGTLPPAA
jgi:8-oxo-dGTP diphosphatase